MHCIQGNVCKPQLKHILFLWKDFSSGNWQDLCYSKELIFNCIYDQAWWQLWILHNKFVSWTQSLLNVKFKIAIPWKYFKFVDVIYFIRQSFISKRVSLGWFSVCWWYNLLYRTNFNLQMDASAPFIGHWQTHSEIVALTVSVGLLPNWYYTKCIESKVPQVCWCNLLYRTNFNF